MITPRPALVLVCDYFISRFFFLPVSGNSCNGSTSYRRRETGLTKARVKHFQMSLPFLRFSNTWFETFGWLLFEMSLTIISHFDFPYQFYLPLMIDFVTCSVHSNIWEFEMLFAYFKQKACYCKFGNANLNCTNSPTFFFV